MLLWFLLTNYATSKATYMGFMHEKQNKDTLKVGESDF